jgi:hypothetical protein
MGVDFDPRQMIVGGLILGLDGPTMQSRHLLGVCAHGLGLLFLTFEAMYIQAVCSVHQVKDRQDQKRGLSSQRFA